MVKLVFKNDEKSIHKIKVTILAHHENNKSSEAGTSFPTDQANDPKKQESEMETDIVLV